MYTVCFIYTLMMTQFKQTQPCLVEKQIKSWMRVRGHEWEKESGEVLICTRQMGGQIHWRGNSSKECTLSSDLKAESNSFDLKYQVLTTQLTVSGHKAGFEIGWQYEHIKSLEHHKHQKMQQADRSFMFCFMFSRDICFALKGEFCFYVQQSLSTDLRIRSMSFSIKIFVFNCF